MSRFFDEPMTCTNSTETEPLAEADAERIRNEIAAAYGIPVRFLAPNLAAIDGSEVHGARGPIVIVDDTLTDIFGRPVHIDARHRLKLPPPQYEGAPPNNRHERRTAAALSRKSKSR